MTPLIVLSSVHYAISTLVPRRTYLWSFWHRLFITADVYARLNPPSESR